MTAFVRDGCMDGGVDGTDKEIGGQRSDVRGQTSKKGQYDLDNSDEHC